MSGERVAAALTMGVLGLAMVGVGVSARRGRLQLALGGWTRESASSASWEAAHVTIGTWFVVAGAIAVASAGAVLISPAAWAGPWVVVGSVVLLPVVVVGVVRGTNRLERPATTEMWPPTCDRALFVRQSNTCSLRRSAVSVRCSGRSIPSTTRRSVS